MKKPVPGIKLYRKLRYRKGFGVHSPFVYSLITKVIEEKDSFYAFDEIERWRKTMLAANSSLSETTAKETQSHKFGALLFRLALYFKCRNILQIGGSTGIMSLYLSMASPRSCDCYVMEDRQGLLDGVKPFAEKRGLNNLHFLENDYAAELKKRTVLLEKMDMVFINHTVSEKAEELLKLALPLFHEKTILLIDNIINDKKMASLWNKVCTDARVRTCIDLYALGIAFFDSNLPKKQYKSYFDYGKKQNLHTQRRRRLYFPRRRKSSAKNASTH